VEKQQEVTVKGSELSDLPKEVPIAPEESPPVQKDEVLGENTAMRQVTGVMSQDEVSVTRKSSELVVEATPQLQSSITAFYINIEAFRDFQHGLVSKKDEQIAYLKEIYALHKLRDHSKKRFKEGDPTAPKLHVKVAAPYNIANLQSLPARLQDDIYVKTFWTGLELPTDYQEGTLSVVHADDPKGEWLYCHLQLGTQEKYYRLPSSCLQLVNAEAFLPYFERPGSTPQIHAYYAMYSYTPTLKDPVKDNIGLHKIKYSNIILSVDEPGTKWGLGVCLNASKCRLGYFPWNIVAQLPLYQPPSG
jgi:hypothetical protein